MRKFSGLNVSPGCALGNSLSAIKQAHTELHLLTRMRASPILLASQIELCDVLLVEIAGIRSSLARDLKQTGGPRALSHFGLES
jgi:hypothetical protein